MYIVCARTCICKYLSVLFLSLKIHIPMKSVQHNVCGRKIFRTCKIMSSLLRRFYSFKTLLKHILDTQDDRQLFGFFSRVILIIV